MDTIVHAKERQAAEANKNASSLLEQIDEERRNEETKKVINLFKKNQTLTYFFNSYSFIIFSFQFMVIFKFIDN